jgi:hypothetical protein
MNNLGFLHSAAGGIRDGSKPLLYMAAVACLLSSSAPTTAGAATIDATSGGAVTTDGVDNTKAIQKAIDDSAAGDTILFPPGTYGVAGTIVFKSDRNYSGAGATLKRTTPGGFAACTEHDRGKNMLIEGLTFDSAGFAFTGSGNVKASRIRIRGCSFTNIRQKTYPFDTGIYIPIGGIQCEFTGNHFRNIHGDNGLITWNLDQTRITDNDFDGVNEGMHLNGATVACSVLRNRGVHMHRMGIEIQGSNNANLVVEDNHFANWDSPFMDSFGLSIVPGSGPNILVRYNTLLARPPVPGTWTNRFGYGIELGGDVLCRDNLTEGFWWVGIIIGGKNTTVTHNVLRGAESGQYTTPTKVSLEPGSDAPTETIAENEAIPTASYIENPTDLTAKVSGKRVELSWRAHSTKETGFKVERRRPGQEYAVIATLPASSTSYTDDHLAAAGEYVYRIQAFDDAGDITYSPSLLVVIRESPSIRQGKTPSSRNFFSRNQVTPRVSPYR